MSLWSSGWALDSNSKETGSIPVGDTKFKGESIAGN